MDSIGKKTKVAADIAGQLSLDNVSVINARIENLPERYDFVVSRAVARMEKIVAWTREKSDRERLRASPTASYV